MLTIKCSICESVIIGLLWAKEETIWCLDTTCDLTILSALKPHHNTYIFFFKCTSILNQENAIHDRFGYPLLIIIIIIGSCYTGQSFFAGHPSLYTSHVTYIAYVVTKASSALSCQSYVLSLFFPREIQVLYPLFLGSKLRNPMTWLIYRCQEFSTIGFI